ncbi:MAG: glycosyltransferase family 1 protein [Chitinophagaceae bacterium]|nr:glycosyltransferase family 1 protein [Chitinophagaceae bacterium]
MGFDLPVAISKYVKLGKFGKKLHTFLPVEAWGRKGNRELAVKFKNFRPELVLVVGNCPVNFGILAFMKSISPDSKIVLFWPDTLINLEQQQLNAASFIDVAAVYSKACEPLFSKMGYGKTAWVPFAGDLNFLKGKVAIGSSFLYDLSFIGGWRPERESYLSVIADNFPSLRIHVQGFYWKENCKDKRLLNSFSPTPLLAGDFGDLIRQSAINLNVIDDTNYPGANMRFFEVPAAGGLQLCSSCPELESQFTDMEKIIFFNGPDEMVSKIKWIVEHPEQADVIRKAGHEYVKENHTYRNRINQLISI